MEPRFPSLCFPATEPEISKASLEFRKNWIDTFLPERIRTQLKAGFDQLVSGHLEPVEYLENPVWTSQEQLGLSPGTIPSSETEPARSPGR